MEKHDFKAGDVDAPTDAQIPYAKDVTNSDNAAGLVQNKGGPKLDSKSEGDKIRRKSKVSLHSDVGSHSLPNSRKNSTHCNGFPQTGDGVSIAPGHKLYPVYSGIAVAPQTHGNVRKLSAYQRPFNVDAPRSRRFSMEPFYLSPHKVAGEISHACMHEMHGRMHPRASVFSLDNYSDGGFSGGDEGERLPSHHHYRYSIFDNQRPTLFQLREEAKVTVTVFTTRNM